MQTIFVMNESQRKKDEIFKSLQREGTPVYWYYDYEDAVFKSLVEKGVLKYYVKYAWNNGKEFELLRKDSNVLMDSISDLNKVLITKSDYEQFPQKQEFKKNM